MRSVNQRRRAFDLVVALPLFALSIPIQLVVAATVKLTSQGPVLYNSRRVGLHGEEFALYKFRSMVVNPGAVTWRQFTVAGDSRVTTVGRILRLSKLDELPQLWNVVAGQMSLVGPRPEHPDYVADYSDRQRTVLDYRPGVTSPASVVMRDEEEVLRLLGGDHDRTYRQLVLPIKLDLDLSYFPIAGVRDDVAVIWSTIRSIARPSDPRRLADELRTFVDHGVEAS